MAKTFLKKVYFLLKHWFAGPIIIFGSMILMPTLITLIWSKPTDPHIIIFCLSFVMFIIIAEIFFRFVHRLIVGHPYRLNIPFSFKDLYIEPHPYLPFIYKAMASSQKAGAVDYPLHKGKYNYAQTRTNSMRFNDGPTGEREIIIPKPKGQYRIVCLGGSTTGNYIEEGGNVYSYPLILEKLLQDETGPDVVVNNCGQGGYNSAEILVRFALQVIDTEPDLVVFCHAYNDVLSYLTNDYSSDYSHSRRNLGENYWKYRISGLLPKIPLAFIDFFVTKWLPGNIRFGSNLQEQVSKGTLNLENDPTEGLQTYKRNIKHIVDLCQANNIDVVLSTYCHFLHDTIKNSPLHQRYAQIVELENQQIRELAGKYDLALVDNAKLIAKKDENFVDSVHFTPKGMLQLAQNIADEILHLKLIPEKNKWDPNNI